MVLPKDKTSHGGEGSSWERWPPPGGAVSCLTLYSKVPDGVFYFSHLSAQLVMVSLPKYFTISSFDLFISEGTG